MASRVESCARELAGVVAKINPGKTIVSGEIRFVEKLQELIEAVEAEDLTSELHTAVRKRAMEIVEFGNTEVDDDATISVGEGGAWVRAWIWIGDYDGDEEELEG